MTSSHRSAGEAALLRASLRAHPRPALMLSSTGLALILATPAFAGPYPCPTPVSNQNTTCTVPANSGADSVSVVNAPGPDEAPASYALDNSSNLSAPGGATSVLKLSLQGGFGQYYDDDGNGFAGRDAGAATLFNNGALRLYPSASTSNGDDGFTGVGDDSGALFGIFVRSRGGDGADAPYSPGGGGDGGAGGGAGAVTVTQFHLGDIGIIGTGANGVAGIYAEAQGGAGGKQDANPFFAQKGGDGGGYGSATLTIDGRVEIQATSSGFIWGLGAEAVGGEGASSAANFAKGGRAGDVHVELLGSGDVTVEATRDGAKTFDQGVRGIAARSIGGAGRYSDDGDRNGADGGGGGVVEVRSAGSVTVSRGGAAVDGDGVSGGIVAISQGGAGGSSANTINNTTGQRGGRGAAGQYVLVASTGDVTVAGEGMVGIHASSGGGLGGKGVNDGYGGDAGLGNQVELSLNGSVATSGDDAVGVRGVSQGGDGGMQDSSAGLFDFPTVAAGAGGDALGVTLNNLTHDIAVGPDFQAGATVFTTGAHAEGVVLQSLGGAGGNAKGALVFFGNGVADSGEGGDGGDVTMDAKIDVTTRGDYSSGILAQSIGGGGGNVGESSGAISVAGDAGSGAHSGVVSVTSHGAIHTSGLSAIGIHAQSVSGGGGRAASDLGVVSVGGQGGSSPKANNAGVSLTGNVTTAGDYAYGVQVQSIGGGGGDGGSVFALSTGSIPATAVGGDGGAAGDGGQAAIRQGGGTVTTFGDNAHGLVAMSVGGGGGSGGDARATGIGLLTLSMAGGADSGGAGDRASVAIDGAKVSTSGSHALGAAALSVGGGGGAGGSSTSFDLGLGLAFDISVGGRGGGGGAGGAASMSLTDAQVVTGARNDLTVNDAPGVVALSVGGGGGVAGSSASRAIDFTVPSDAPQVDLELSLAIGGKGGAGGDGAAVASTLSGSQVTTQSDGSAGVVALSVGGGGGLGGDAGASGALLVLPKTGEDKITITANIGLGGDGGASGQGGAAQARLAGSAVRTEGDFSNGVLVASIGGGGGAGGVGSAEKFILEIPGGGGDDDEEDEGEEGGAKSFSLNFTLGLGGKGGSSDHGGALSYAQDATSSVTTTGEASKGVLLHTIGGGGGASQSATVGLGTSILPAGVNVSVGRNGASGGDGGDIAELTLDGVVTTYGADSDGVMVQSIGGGGGVGGSTGGAGADEDGYIKEVNEIVEDAKRLFDIRVSVGGRGGAAGDGGDIGGDTPASFGGTIATYGDFSAGLVAQSIGGGGGAAGAANVETSIALIRAFVAVGGSGGAAGDGGDIRFAFDDGAVATQGVGSYGIFLQSIGGGGGISGDASRSVCKKLNIGGGWAGAAAAAIGGFDEEVTPEDLCVDIPSFIDTDGRAGVSGDGGAIAAGLNGGSVTVTTLGDFSHGIVAQSVGGGGGAAASGNSVELGNADATPDDLSTLIALGAAGGSTRSIGAGGVVTLDGTFKISTAGDGAAGLLAQSISGGGGFAGANGIAGVSLGGLYADQGDALPTVSLTADGETVLLTSGQGSHAILAQAIGGGGGFVAGALDDAALDGGEIEVSLGAAAQTLGDGGPVTVVQQGVISTTGDFARAILAQGIGAGGGVYSGVDAGASGPGVRVPVTLGASDSAGGGGAVKVTAYGGTGGIATGGLGADGILAQSIGGGGGVADIAARNAADASPTTQVSLGTQAGTGNNAKGATVNVLLSGGRGVPSIRTEGDGAYGVLAQSIGAGGGVVTDLTRAEIDVHLGTTTSGNNRGAADAVDVSDFVSLVTAGDDAHGIVAQSIGGGGGVARLNASGGSATLGMKPTAPFNSGVNDGGDVTVAMGFAGVSGTTGDHAIGILAQSIGGGGGVLTTAGGPLDALSLGQASAFENHGGAVSVTLKANSGSLATTGEGSHGIVAQSIGGGGGIAGDISVAKGIFPDFEGNDSFYTGNFGSGDGGAVTVSVEDDLTTTGAGAFGVIAQSIGGGGGIAGAGDVADAGRPYIGKTSARTNDSGVTNAAGAVTVNVAEGGSITASGPNSIGIFAQSLGDLRPGPAETQTVTINLAGAVSGGAFGVMIQGGNAGNRLTVASTGSLRSDAGTAIYYVGETSDENSNLIVENHGHIEGDAAGYHANGFSFYLTYEDAAATAARAEISSLIPAPKQRNAALTLVNRRDGLLSGAQRYRGDVVNNGVMLIGEDGAMNALTIAGDFTQGDRGRTVAEVDFLKRRGDALRVKGDAAFDGKLTIAPRAVLKGASFNLITVEGEFTGRFDEIASELFLYGQRIRPNGVTIGPITADFDQARFGLNARQRSISTYLEAVFETAEEDYATTFGDLEAAVALNPSNFGALLDGLSPGASLAAAAANIELSQSRFDRLLGCGETPWDRSAATASRCVIADASGRSLSQGGDGGAPGYDAGIYTMALGVRAPFAPHLTAGLMAGYESASFNGDGGADSEGDTFTLGASVTRAYGAMSLSAAAGGSFGVHDVTRNFAAPGGVEKARGEYDAWSVGLRGRIDYGIVFGDTRVTPALDLDLIHAGSDGYRERGAGAFDLTVDGGQETAFRATPSLGIAQAFALSETTRMVTWATAGISFSTTDAFMTTARFTGSAAAGGFSAATPVADAAARVSAGISFAATERLHVGLRYDGAFGSGYTGHAGAVRVDWAF